jgi:S-formylglutathione hydrolase FrmB
MHFSTRLASLLLIAPMLFAQPPAQKKWPSQPAAWVDPDKGEPAGTHYKTFPSKLAAASALPSGEVSYLIYLPPSYETDTAKRYPVVYWLHGLNGNQRAGATFLQQMVPVAAAGKIPEMIVVLVNGMKDSFYVDSPDGKWPIESVIIKELIPHIDLTYRTLARREDRAIEGYSMGSYGVAHLAFKYPELFGIVGVNAGALITPRAAVQPAVYEKMFGSSDAYVQANDPFALLKKNADAIRGKTFIWVAVGGDDSLLSRNKALDDALTELKIEHDWEVVAGVAHNPPLFYKTLGEKSMVNYQKAFAKMTSSR